MLIIEGTDMVGKSTLAKSILQHEWFQSNGYVYRHFGKLPHGFDYCEDYMHHAVMKSVQDRFHLSEIVYALAARQGKTDLCPEKYRLVDGFLRMMGSFTVVIVAHDNLLQRRYKESDHPFTFEQICDANQLFHSIDNYGHGYKPDVDMTIQLSLNNQWVSEEQIHDIVERYTERIIPILRRRHRHDAGRCFLD